MSDIEEAGAGGPTVPPDLVEAAVRAAARHKSDVADVPVVAIAREAGVSRSTLLRRLGGSRRALDEAVRAAGMDPGGRSPVRERAIESGARLISERGLGAVTLEAVAVAAECSVHSLYATFGGRDQLLYAIFDRHTPFVDLKDAVDKAGDDLEDTVTRIYRLLAEALSRQPRVLPALFSDMLARPSEASARTVMSYLTPRVLGGLGRWLTAEVAAGRIRDLPLPLLLQQMLAPIMIHFLTRPVLGEVSEISLPDTDEAYAVFAQAFLRAMAVNHRTGSTRKRHPTTREEDQ